ncbi:DUF21 domain-containing protein [Guyparkeria sp. 1SP6A2]|nr:DUF21 domain-containing protein [Guyparkeria sp. 1SP6A2]
MITFVSWAAILVCLSQSAMFSGLNLGIFSLSRLELEVEAKKGNPLASRVLHLREDSNFALVTILWGNVSVNVLLALVSGSILTGIVAFLFSTVIITVFAEIIPQAYFSRHALKVSGVLAPVLRFYQFVLYPVARPSAWLLDRWLGGEPMNYLREHDLRQMIQLHMEASGTEISRVEGQGALNFLDIDEVPLDDEGEPIDPGSVIQMTFEDGRPVFPRIEPTPADPFLRRIDSSRKRWVVIVDQGGSPQLVINSGDFLREALFEPDHFNPYRHCHRPIILREGTRQLGGLIRRFQVKPPELGDDILEEDVILLWIDHPRVLTASDILGRLLRGIAMPPESAARARS